MQSSSCLGLLNLNNCTHCWAEVLSYLPQTDIDVGPYAGLLIQLTLGKVLQQLVVQDRVTQLWGQKNHRLRRKKKRHNLSLEAKKHNQCVPL